MQDTIVVAMQTQLDDIKWMLQKSSCFYPYEQLSEQLCFQVFAIMTTMPYDSLGQQERVTIWTKLYKG